MQIRSSSWNPCLLINGGGCRFQYSRTLSDIPFLYQTFQFSLKFSEIKKSRLGMFQWHNIHTKFGGKWSTDASLNGEDKGKKTASLSQSFFLSFQAGRQVKKGPKGRPPSIP